MWNNVFFWAVVACCAIVLEFLVFISRRKYKRSVYAITGIVAILMFEVPRLVIPLLPQPSLKLSEGVVRFLGGIFFWAGVAVVLGAFVQIMQAKREGWKLRTRGLYGVVRHPMYFGDILWAFGWSIMHNAFYGVLLTPVWLFLRYTLAVLEEEKLLEKYKAEYESYIESVRNRIIPFVL